MLLIVDVFALLSPRFGKYVQADENVTLAGRVTLSRLINDVINYPRTSISLMEPSLIRNISCSGNILPFQ